VTRFGDWQIEAREVNARGDSMKGVLLWMPNIGQTIFARRGRIEKTDDGGTEIRLEAGQVVLSARGDPNTLAFETSTTRLPAAEELKREKEDRYKSLSLGDLANRAKRFKKNKKEGLSRAAIEFHRRFSMPFATLVFGVLSVPLFLLRSNFSRAAGGVLGLLCTISYYGLIQLSEGLAQSKVIDIAVAAWLPNGILTLLGAVLIIRARREGVLGHTFDRPQVSQPLHTRFMRFTRLQRATQEKPHERRPRSYPLPRYIAGRFMGLVLLSFAILLVAYLLIDIMERLEWFSRHHATGIEILHFYGARSVLLASRIVPMSLLVATALTVSLLAAEGELIGMRSCGIPAPRALLPVLCLAALIVPADAALNNVLVPRANALADKIKREEIKEAVTLRRDARRKSAVWYRSGNQVLEADYFDPDRGWAMGLSIYEIGENRLPVKRTDASSARHVGNGWWVLRDAASIEVSDEKVREVEASQFAFLGEALPAEVDTMHIGVAEVAALIGEAEADHVDSTPLRVDLHVKLAQPLACIVLPALVLFFAVGGPPFPGPAQTLLLSMVVGISYILLTGVFRSLGYGGALPETVGGWGPIMFFVAIAGFFGLRLWRRL
jgi:lipopolysaccharide export system permease protein